MIQREGHTLACLLRKQMFENGATMAACVVLHPQDEHLNIKVVAEDPKSCVLQSIHFAKLDVTKALNVFKSYSHCVDASSR